MSEPTADSIRWQAFFQQSTQPLFLVNRRRRLLFANRAWEACSGLTLAEVRGRVCRRRAVSAGEEKEEAILGACAPPTDALAGRVCLAHRRVPGRADWWEIQYFPLLGPQGLLGILGAIRVLSAPTDVSFKLPVKLTALRDRKAACYHLDEAATASAALSRVYEQARLAAQTRMPITLLGEPGVGKEWLARAIHQRSEERLRYFARLDADKLPAPRLGELLFNPRNRATGLGVIYLHDPAALPTEWQSRLADTVKLRENPDFPRLIVGFGSDPRIDMQSGRLLEELYYAVSAVTIAIPPLRERLSELPRFIDLFLGRARTLQEHTVNGVGGEAMNVLRAYAWPENLRELQAMLQTACRRAKGERIELADLPFHLKHGSLPVERRLPLDRLLEQVERRLIALALKLTDGNQTRTAELLEIWRPRLLRRVEKLGLGNTGS